MIGLLFAALFVCVGVCAAVDLSRNGGVMPRTNHEENIR